jgi:hypothetical protein
MKTRFSPVHRVSLQRGTYSEEHKRLIEELYISLNHQPSLPQSICEAVRVQNSKDPLS